MLVKFLLFLLLFLLVASPLERKESFPRSALFAVFLLSLSHMLPFSSSSQGQASLHSFYPLCPAKSPVKQSSTPRDASVRKPDLSLAIAIYFWPSTLQLKCYDSFISLLPVVSVVWWIWLKYIKVNIKKHFISRTCFSKLSPKPITATFETCLGGFLGLLHGNFAGKLPFTVYFIFFHNLYGYNCLFKFEC